MRAVNRHRSATVSIAHHWPRVAFQWVPMKEGLLRPVGQCRTVNQKSTSENYVAMPNLPQPQGRQAPSPGGLRPSRRCRHGPYVAHGHATHRCRQAGRQAQVRARHAMPVHRHICDTVESRCRTPRAGTTRKQSAPRHGMSVDCSPQPTAAGDAAGPWVGGPAMDGWYLVGRPKPIHQGSISRYRNNAVKVGTDVTRPARAFV